jgi:collagenase-like PrtC family protease
MGMLRVGFIDAMTQVASAVDLGCQEALISVEGCSREGGLRFGELTAMITALEHHGVKPVVLLDRLIEQGRYRDMMGLLDSWPTICFRVSDLGLAQHLNSQDRAFQLGLESGHANSEAINVWLELLPKVERVVLNHQIPRRNLLPLLSNLSISTEMLVFGPLAMYYTPRRLLSWAGAESDQSLIQADDMGLGEYELVESEAGTVMRYNKWLSLMPHLEELEGAGLGAMRLDLRLMSSEELQLLQRGLKDPSYPLKTEFPKPLLHGFYGDNRSDSVFSKLVGRRPDMEKELLGEVVDRTKTRLLLWTFSAIEDGDRIRAKDGKGNWHEWVLDDSRNMDGEGHGKSVTSGDLILVKRPKKLPVGTYIYRCAP